MDLCENGEIPLVKVRLPEDPGVLPSVSMVHMLFYFSLLPKNSELDILDTCVYSSRKIIIHVL